ncbi:MAG TPA: aldo/keto reductase [Acidimicrobiia bacterium]
MTTIASLGRRKLGRRGPEVTRLGLGGAPLGNMFTTVADEDAHATVDAAWNAGIRYFDTAPFYGHGLAEQRLGAGLAGRQRDDYVVSTKVGRVLEPSPGADTSIFKIEPDLAAVFDYSRDGVLRSFEASLSRLGLDRVDVVLVHDPDSHEDDALSGAFPALVELREQGVVRAIGAGMNQSAMLQRFVERVDLDCVLLAGRYTLLDRSGTALLDLCAERSVGVIIGGVFNSGVLAQPDPAATYDYWPAPPATVDAAQRYEQVARGHDVPLPALALQFALRHPAVTSVVVGARTAAEITFDATCATHPIPATAWTQL